MAHLLCVCAPRADNSSGAKSSTAMTAATASAVDLQLRGLLRVDHALSLRGSISRTRALRMRSRNGCAATVRSNARSSSAVPSSAAGPEQALDQAIARRPTGGQDFRADRGQSVGGPALPPPDRQNDEAQEPRHGPIREIDDDLVEARLDGGEAAFHAPFEQREIVGLAAFVVPALERGGRQIQLGEHVAEARGQHLLPLEPAAEAEQRQIDREREGRGVAAKLPSNVQAAARAPQPERPTRESTHQAPPARRQTSPPLRARVQARKIRCHHK